MELFNGGSLRSYLKNKEINPLDAQTILYSFTNCLAELHYIGFVHCNLHSGNVLIRPSFGPLPAVISDLALSRSINSSVDQKNGSYGVIPFMAPELFQGGQHSKATDVYAVGIIMWELWTGEQPFSEYDHDRLLCCKIVQGLRPPVDKGIPDFWAKLMQRCWDGDPAKRPSAGEIDYEVLFGWKDFHDVGLAPEIQAQADAARQYRANHPQPTKEKHQGAIYTSRFIPCITTSTVSLSIQSENEKAKELAAGPSRCDPFAELEMKNKVLRDQNAELEKQLHEAQKAAESVKAALGDTINVGWSDNDKNYSVQLGKDINKLKNALKEFTQLKGRRITLDQQGVNTLLQKYDCRVDPTTKLIISSTLQRYIIEEVLRYTNSYFNKCIEDLDGKSNKELEQYTKADLNYFLEGTILNITSSLKRYIKEFAERRKGEDGLTRMTGVKIRQQVYAVLGSRGFAAADHPFLVKLVKYILSELEKCRQIKDESRKKDIEELAPSTILEIVRIFYFRFQTQIPVVEYHFFESGTKFDPATMECAQDDDGEDEAQVVEICFFPLVGVNILDKEKRQIFNKARVQLRPGFSS